VSDVAKLRAALRESLPDVDHAGSNPDRDPEFMYVPPSHARALDPDSSVVEGIRGSGKSFWWSHLSSDPHRKYVEEAFPEARIGDNVRVVKAFGAQSHSVDAPDQDVLASLMKQGFSPRSIWRAVIAQKLQFESPFPITGTWKERVGWTSENPEEFGDLLLAADKVLDKEGTTLVVLFDALDRLSDEWSRIRPLAKALLQLALNMRATRRIRLKVFVRPDMLQDREIIGFPDASKLLGRKASLAWRRADLYALLFQCVGNAKGGGAAFRKRSFEITGEMWQRSGGAKHVLPQALRTDELLQEKLFIALAGKAMAAGPSGFKRGKPYTWLVNHLQDGLDQVSPRSFFAAVRQAADETPAENPLPLSYNAIHAGVTAASKIRVQEISTEDYPWVDLVMAPLKGNLTVPCLEADIRQLWRADKTLEELTKRLSRSSNEVKLPPQHLNEGFEGVLVELESLGLIKRLAEKRVQMPDVYRIAFGLGRRGGVKPVR
jgi:hypothetical protein